MQPDATAPGYYIWGIDNTAYGPIELPMLVSWIQEERVISSTWLYVERENAWCKAADVAELQIFFKPRRKLEAQRGGAGAQGIQPGALRRVKALAEMSDEQLATLLTYAEILPVRAFTQVFRKGDPGDVMYGILEGELRSCVTVDGKECLIATLGPGAIFGEISLFDKGPHAADVISNQESLLVKISADAVSKIDKEAPEVALALVTGLVKAIAGRVRTLTRRYEESVHGAHQKKALHLD
jgi:CRP-like cAMP-binding protein